MIASIYEVRECPECSGTNLSYLEERDQVVCRECGLVYEPLTPSEDKKLVKTSGSKNQASSKSSKKPAKKKAAPKKKGKKK
ncbi:MAG: hypothetical protein AABX47_09140 [Nanoarchaeota archaeon]